MSVSASAAAIRPVDLRCEGVGDPICIDIAQPRLSWRLESRDGDSRQRAFRIFAATRLGLLRAGDADLWDSGKVESPESLGIAYAGSPLASGLDVFWRVRVWDGAGNARSSDAARFGVGPLSPRDWRAEWITADQTEPSTPEAWYGDRPCPLLRTEFQAPKTIVRARAHVTGLGYYELRINGEKIGDHRLDPGWTEYAERVLYSTFDITDAVHEGDNAVGIILGNGWYNPLPLRLFGRFDMRKALTVGRPRAIAQIEIEYADGSRGTVGTDESWRAGDGPIVRNDVYLGETYDARLEQPGWDRPGFDDSSWRRAALAHEPAGSLQAQLTPPIRATRTLTPIAVSELRPGQYLFDMGQNFAGVVTLRVEGERGTRVRLRYGELLHDDGTLNVWTSCCTQIKAGGAKGGPGAPETAEQSDEYVLKGGGPETFTPRFTFHGFRYVEVTGLPERPTLDTLTGHLLHSDLPVASEFECSNELLNRVHSVVDWTLRSNLLGVQSDCPHREKLGYGGDIVAASETAMLMLDMSHFYAKAVRDFADAADPENGGFPETAPFVGIADGGFGGQSGPIGWGTAHPMLLRQLYQYYGDRRLIEEQYGAVKRWVELLRDSAPDLVIHHGIGDHESLAAKPTPLTSTAFFHYNASLLAWMAEIVGSDVDAAEYSALADAIAHAFNERFLNRETGAYDSGSQCCQAFALYFGLVPEDVREKALGVLARDIEAHDGHLTTGIFGTKYLLDVLSENGRMDLAYEIATQRSFPGWGYMLDNGATTLWERWQVDDRVFSHNHPMFGSISEWLIKHVAGIAPAEDAVGFDRVVISPKPAPGLTSARATYHSVRGSISVAWSIEDGEMVIDVDTPPDCTAIVERP